MTRTPALVRTVRLGTYTVKLYDIGCYDARGCTALGYRVIACGVPLAHCMTPDGAVYGSPLHADDSDATMQCAINLICYHEVGSYRGYTSSDMIGLAIQADLRWSR